MTEPSGRALTAVADLEEENGVGMVLTLVFFFGLPRGGMKCELAGKFRERKKIKNEVDRSLIDNDPTAPEPRRSRFACYSTRHRFRN
jgi:hypothetical protein